MPTSLETPSESQGRGAIAFYSITPATPELLQLLRNPPNVILLYDLHPRLPVGCSLCFIGGTVTILVPVFIVDWQTYQPVLSGSPSSLPIRLTATLAYAHAIQELNKVIDRAEVLGNRMDCWSRDRQFSLDFLDFPCDTNTMNIVLNGLNAFTSCNLFGQAAGSCRTQPCHRAAKPASPRQLEATIG